MPPYASGGSSTCTISSLAPEARASDVATSSDPSLMAEKSVATSIFEAFIVLLLRALNGGSNHNFQSRSKTSQSQCHDCGCKMECWRRTRNQGKMKECGGLTIFGRATEPRDVCCNAHLTAPPHTFRTLSSNRKTCWSQLCRAMFSC